MNISEKKFLERNLFRKLRDQASIIERKNVVDNVKIFVDRYFEKYKKINYIAIYWPLKNEVDVTSLKNKFHVALPKCQEKKSLSFHRWDDKPLAKDFEGILSPTNSDLLSYEKISLIFVPCLSVDKNFIRLGYGGGYFDKLRFDKNWRDIPCIGLLTSNCVSKTPLTKADWDIPLSGFITENEILV